jgi:hypothetical protein
MCGVGTPLPRKSNYQKASTESFAPCAKFSQQKFQATLQGLLLACRPYAGIWYHTYIHIWNTEPENRNCTQHTIFTKVLKPFSAQGAGNIWQSQRESVSSPLSSSSSNLLEYKHSSGLAPPDAHSPQHGPHLLWTPCLSSPFHQWQGCAWSDYLPPKLSSRLILSWFERERERVSINNEKQYRVPVISCIARRTLVSGVTVISLFCGHRI